jgi:hypothetical protein
MAKKKTKTVGRSSVTGKFVTSHELRTNKRETLKETIRLDVPKRGDHSHLEETIRDPQPKRGDHSHLEETIRQTE